MDCPEGLVWDQEAYTCVLPEGVLGVQKLGDGLNEVYKELENK